MIGVPYANRGHTSTDGVIGYFVNTLAVRVKAAADVGFADVVSLARQAMLDAMAHGDVPFVEVVSAVSAGAGDPSRTPVYQTMVSDVVNGDNATDGGEGNLGLSNAVSVNDIGAFEGLMAASFADDAPSEDDGGGDDTVTAKFELLLDMLTVDTLIC